MICKIQYLEVISVLITDGYDETGRGGFILSGQKTDLVTEVQ